MAIIITVIYYKDLNNLVTLITLTALNTLKD